MAEINVMIAIRKAAPLVVTFIACAIMLYALYSVINPLLRSIIYVVLFFLCLALLYFLVSLCVKDTRTDYEKKRDRLLSKAAGQIKSLGYERISIAEFSAQRRYAKLGGSLNADDLQSQIASLKDARAGLDKIAKFEVVVILALIAIYFNFVSSLSFAGVSLNITEAFTEALLFLFAVAQAVHILASWDVEGESQFLRLVSEKEPSLVRSRVEIQNLLRSKLVVSEWNEAYRSREVEAGLRVTGLLLILPPLVFSLAVGLLVPFALIIHLSVLMAQSHEYSYLSMWLMVFVCIMILMRLVVWPRMKNFELDIIEPIVEKNFYSNVDTLGELGAMAAVKAEINLLASVTPESYLELSEKALADIPGLPVVRAAKKFRVLRESAEQITRAKDA